MYNVLSCTYVHCWFRLQNASYQITWDNTELQTGSRKEPGETTEESFACVRKRIVQTMAEFRENHIVIIIIIIIIVVSVIANSVYL